jgi:tryptophanase
MMMGDESYAGSASFFQLKDTITRITRKKKHCFCSNQLGIHGDLKNGPRRNKVSGYYRLAFPIRHLSPNPLDL